MAERFVAGVDLGTSALKCAIFDATGRRHAAARIAYATRVDGEVAEQQAGDWWRSLCEALAITTARLPGQIVSIGIAGHGPSPVIVDAELEPVAPVMTWRDRRCGGVSLPLAAMTGPERLGLHFAARAAWLRDHAPASFARATSVLHSGDYLAARLTGQRRSTGWSGEHAFAAADLPAALVPEDNVRPMFIANDVGGLSRGTRVISVGLDSFAGTLGSGVGAPGDACINGGSSAVVAMVGGVEGCRFRLGPYGIHSRPIAAGIALERVLEPVDPHRRGAILREASCGPPSAEAGTCDSLGELDLDELIVRTGRVSATRTVLDAIVLGERRLLAQLEQAHGTATRVRLVGGQAGVVEVAQLVADALGRQIEVPRIAESGTLGAAILAATELGWDTTGMVQLAYTLEPSRAAAAYAAL